MCGCFFTFVFDKEKKQGTNFYLPFLQLVVVGRLAASLAVFGAVVVRVHFAVAFAGLQNFCVTKLCASVID